MIMMIIMARRNVLCFVLLIVGMIFIEMSAVVIYAAGVRIATSRTSIPEGGTLTIQATLVPKPGQFGRQDRIAGVELWPYVNGKQWGCAEKTNRRGQATFMIPLPEVGAARIQVAAQGPVRAVFPVGQPLARQARASNTVVVHVLARKFTVPAHRRHLVGMEYEPWFTPLNVTWNTAESIPLLGKYSSLNPAVIRQHALWLDQMGINYILIDWSNNLWGKTYFRQCPPNARQLISATTLLLKTYARMRHQGIATPRVTLLLGLDNGPVTTTTAINGEMAWIYRNYIQNPHFAGLWLDYHKKPLIVIFNGGGPGFLAGKLAAGEPPINTHDFTVRWMSSQLQYTHDTHGHAIAGYWSWMDGSIRPIPTYYRGQCEALTITPAYFAAGGWLAPSARARDNGFTYVREFNTALHYRPHFLNICQWNEFAGQSIGHGYGPRHNQYVDCYNLHLNNDIEPTSLTACAYRGCGGWGFYYLNLTRAFVHLYHQEHPRSTILAIGAPHRGQVVKTPRITVRWACVGKQPRSFTLQLDGRKIAGNINSAARTYTVLLSGLKPGRHELTLRANGAVSVFDLSYRQQSQRLAHPASAVARVIFFTNKVNSTDVHGHTATPVAASRTAADPEVAGPDTWGAIDALGRVLPHYRTVGPPRKNKSVGIFYFTAYNHPAYRFAKGKKEYYLYDNDKIIARRHYRPGWYLIGPLHTVHWWGEPLVGYYRSSDPWVIRQNAEMLSDAGVNTLIFDNTNGPTYPNTQRAIFKTFERLRKLGDATPDFACFTGHGAWNTDYRNIYQKGLYKNLWFRWEGKPLLLYVGQAGQIPTDERKFFTLRYCWAWTGGKNRWGWDNVAPGNRWEYAWHSNPKVPEEMPVAVGGWATSNIGRSFHNGVEPPRALQNPAAGLCFAEQWNHALKVDPAFVFITGWNEWTAGCFPSGGAGPGSWPEMLGHPVKPGDPIYVDEFDSEFSRDAQPMKGGFEDDYYYQMVTGIRRYKGVQPLPSVSMATIHLAESWNQWASVNPLFINNIGLAVHRDYQGWGNGPRLPVYRNNTGRNDIVGAKVCYDAKNMYFWVQTRKTITSWKSPNWMLLFINSTGNPHKGWLGYNYVIDRKVLNDHTTTLQKNIGNQYKWKIIGKVQYRVKGDQMEVVVPRKLLGLAGKLPADIHFKWADNIQQTGKWSDFYLNGNCAPPFRYYYRAKFRR